MPPKLSEYINLFCKPKSSKVKDEYSDIPIRKNEDELEWEKCGKLIMEQPLLKKDTHSFYVGINLNGSSFQEEVWSFDTIFDLKMKISRSQNVPFRLIIASQEERLLDDHHTLEHHGIGRDSTIDVYTRPIIQK
ncbi:hypothetical protein CRE_32639 [Caenorhabditis remanei]|uniref:Ubiquitin-like domain-containing protein n=1 Tax=Caenorhabditis remanei TaxID=31234 RepID=E3LJU1_CAERE|nr:hypothetical protein CRE_32639 [Caenorhabditis remanei]